MLKVERASRTYKLMCVFLAHSVNLSPCWGGWKKSIEYVSIVLMMFVVFSVKILVENCVSPCCWGEVGENIEYVRIDVCVFSKNIS